MLQKERIRWEEAGEVESLSSLVSPLSAPDKVIAVVKLASAIIVGRMLHVLASVLQKRCLRQDEATGEAGTVVLFVLLLIASAQKVFYGFCSVDTVNHSVLQ
uniref:Uncharacterized protein n=1 Tax=Setaria digitata TaxID=48799 RepID=A0A915PV63_9BILA